MTTGAPVADLTGWRRAAFAGAGVTYDCYEKGSGPGVVLIPEVPGITPEVLGLAEHLVGAGFTVVVPSPFGVPEKVATVGYTIRVLGRLCVSAEFRAFAVNAHRPITDYLRAVAADLAARTPGPGVGVIGMCFTGNFALTMMLEPSMLAPVLSQPALPLDDPAGIEIAPDDLVAVRQRLERDDLTVMAYRFKGDRFCKAQRFAAYSEALGDRFIARVLPDTAANPDTPPFFEQVVASPHSVVTAHLIDEAGQPTIAARDEILSFFTHRLAS